MPPTSDPLPPEPPSQPPLLLLRRRWLIRAAAAAFFVLYQGRLLVTSHHDLSQLFDASFDAPSSHDVVGALDGEGGAGKEILGFRRTRFHQHIRTRRGGDAARGSGGEGFVGVGRTGGAGDAGGNSTSASVRISFELHDPKTVPLTNAFNLYVRCPLGKVLAGKHKIYTGEFRTGDLPPSLSRVTNGFDARGTIRSGRVLDFTTTVSTDLKLLLVGDSVMIQLAQAFDEMVGGVDLGTRSVAWEAWHGHDGGTIVSPARGGGASATWRMTALLSRRGRGRKPANSPGGGWGDLELGLLLNHTWTRHAHGNGAATNSTIGAFDAVVFRVMHGWMQLHEITRDRLVEAVELAHEVLGATTVVLMTIPFTNNVKTREDMKKVEEVNEVIREIARGWRDRANAASSSGVRRVVVLEYGTYYEHVIWSNARHLGYDVSHPLRADREDFALEGPTFALDRVNIGGEWDPSIAMVCSNLKSLGEKRDKCDRNYLFSDGMHVCAETLGGRFAAGLACLLGCAHNGVDDAVRAGRDSDESSERRFWQCERECNEQFFSVVPVEESWIDANVTMASFAL
ncbi:hypothetical protein ACHAWF_005968 [Thalassiosira exigua]